MPLIDSHAHLDFVEDLDGILARAESEGVKKIITIGTSVDSSKKAVEIAQKYSSDDLKIYATCGLHPKDAKKDIEAYGINESIHRLRAIAESSSKVVGIGECGLDYYLGSDMQKATSDKEKNFQRELFKAQLELAAELNLPLIIHCRDGWSEIFDLLSSNGQGLMARGVFHSFTGNWQAAQKALDLGFCISFSGIVTFGNAGEIAEVARKMPIDRMLVETDSPYLSPEPLRGMKNNPKNVKIIARFIADLRKSSLDTIEEATTKNARRLFGI